MADDVDKLRSVIEQDVKFLKEHGIMDYSLLLSAERYSSGSFSRDSGALLDPETPKDAKQIKEESPKKGVNESFDVLDFSTSLNDEPKKKESYRPSKNFFQRTQSGVLTGKDSLNAFLRDQGASADQFNRHTFLSQCGTWIYHVSIIDYLQKWNFDKKAEAFAKKWFLGKNAKGISAVPPEYYARRYTRFMKRNVLVG